MTAFGVLSGLRIVGQKGPALPSVEPVQGVRVRWSAMPDVTVYRLRYRLKGSVWQTVRVKACEKILAPLDAGVWQVAVASLTGVWSPTVEVTI